MAILTRPAGQSAGLASALRLRGWKVYDWPALLLTGLPAVQVPDPAQFDLVMFVSGNAARFYFEQLACASGLAQPVVWPAEVPAATVGLGSAQAVRECAGDTVRLVHPPPDAANFDSEALWAEMQRLDLRPRRVLIVRGGRGLQGHGRSWLAEQFQAAGTEVTLYAAYRREPVVWPPQRRRQLRAWRAGSLCPVWFLSSREAVDALVQQMGAKAILTYWTGCRVIVPHPRIAQEISQLADSCGIATRPVGGAPTEPDPQAIMIQTCMPHDDAVLEAIVN
nr:uroporphyrinogen-III synthase [Pseudomonas sp.]